MYRLIKTLARILIYPFSRVRIIGNPAVPEGAMIVSNHVAMRDPILLACIIKSPIHTMAKKELFSKKLTDKFFRSINVFPVDRKSSDLSSVKTAISILKEKKILLIFPQGTRVKYKRCEKTDAKGGIGLIALRSGAPVVPVSIYYKDYIPRLFRRTTVTFGKPITKEEYFRECGDDRTLVAQYVFSKVVSQLEGSEDAQK
ncbi:MAG TPA: lysophospholipid acyltransferase family protein [Bacillota bacterium]|nr:lysophospholipid acyltransferase family protein [Bacillota bacterium]